MAVKEKFKYILGQKVWNGFTLLEFLIYTGILTTVGFVGTSVFLSISKTYLKNQARAEVTQSLRVAMQLIQQKVQQASRVNRASGSVLDLQMPDGATTTFSLSDGTIYRREGAGPQVAITSNKVTANSLNFLLVTTFQTQIDPVNRWAWNGGASTSTAGEGLGWLDFNPPLGRVRVPLGQGELFGYAHFPTIDGYMSLNCMTTDSCFDVQYKVESDANGVLSGWAWNDTYGWVSFNCANDHDSGTPGIQSYCATVDYKVTINTSTGEFSGWAWSGNTGWISVNCANDHDPVAAGVQPYCATVPYKVVAPRRLGRPVTGVQTSVTLAYRDQGNVLLRYSDSFTFTVVLAQPSDVVASTVNGVPQYSVQTGTTTPALTIGGSGFRQEGTVNPSVRLTRSGYNDVLPSAEFSFINATQLGNGTTDGKFDLAGVATGKWNVVVSNPDGTFGVCVACLDVLP